MILEIDVGNSFLKWRLREPGQLPDQLPSASARIAVDTLSALSFKVLESVESVHVASVADESFNLELAGYIVEAGLPSPLFARTVAACAGVKNSYAQPSLMGVDRWLVMLAAWDKAGSACCIVDCGSAITVDYLDDSGEHRGGYILPGMRLLSSALLENTARVFVDRPAEGFDPSPGKCTSDAVTRGSDFMFDALVQRVLKSLAPGERLFVTGGDGALFHRLADRGEWHPDLVLDGLAHSLGGSV
ncbi:type III pantothenate kinase [Marinobacterium lutimaris]|uniref:Type III pantothenate kinase n=1 Tax=Marinobacterium lutimaris TaxID=568106 RepID=A0A1H6CZ53_9GAMM|nr:type III pantothenate kinase [Marinobacterium lutimaris]SEG77686.1 pantothenate kinase [Marinobacterium lutimaris]